MESSLIDYGKVPANQKSVFFKVTRKGSLEAPPGQFRYALDAPLHFIPVTSRILHKGYITPGGRLPDSYNTPGRKLQIFVRNDAGIVVSASHKFTHLSRRVLIAVQF